MTLKKANAFPDKNFFVESITKDITLLDCLLDLIDNAIDSASSSLGVDDIIQKAGCLKGIEVNINFDKEKFTISDNANGISLDDAETRVFRFGSIKKETNHSIGYYGIGLKRAAFKIGKNIIVESVTSSESLSVTMNLTEWMKEPTNWEFPIDLKGIDQKNEKTGVIVAIDQLYPEIANAFVTTQFKSKLIEIISRDYYFFLRAGLVINIGSTPIIPATLDIKMDGDFLPGIKELSDDGVNITLISGCHSTSESDQDEPENVDPKSKNSGWYIICNNRIILAANKDEKTIWRSKQEGYTSWHPQYNGFIGFAFFVSTDLGKLPWTTTKRAVDPESQVYRTALTHMSAMTTPWIKYTGTRKTDLIEAKKLEDKASSKSLADIIQPNALPKATAIPTFPTIDTNANKIEYSSINFKVEKYRADKCKAEIGNPSIANTELGKYIFEYFYQNNIE